MPGTEVLYSKLPSPKTKFRIVLGGVVQNLITTNFFNLNSPQCVDPYFLLASFLVNVNIGGWRVANGLSTFQGRVRE